MIARTSPPKSLREYRSKNWVRPDSGGANAAATMPRTVSEKRMLDAMISRNGRDSGRFEGMVFTVFIERRSDGWRAGVLKSLDDDCEAARGCRSAIVQDVSHRHDCGLLVISVECRLEQKSWSRWRGNCGKRLRPGVTAYRPSRAVNRLQGGRVAESGSASGTDTSTVCGWN